MLRSAKVVVGVLLGILTLAGTASAGSIGLVPNDGCLKYESSEGSVYFCDTDLRPTGTGYIDPFLRVGRDGAQQDGTPDTYSSGWNTDATKQDLVNAPANDYDFAWSNALNADDLATDVPPPLRPGGPEYVVFTVDINQKGSQGPLGDLLSLNHFELFNCSDNAYTSLSECNGGLSFFNLFNTGDWVTFDYRNHTGSGSGDIDVYIPTDVGFGFDYIALLDGWGCGIAGLTCNTKKANTGLFPDNDGFQEWINTGGSGISVPEPVTLLLFGAGLGAVAVRKRGRNKKRQPAGC